MRNLILTGAAAIALAAMPAVAQDSGASSTASTPPPVQSADEANARAAPAPPTTTVEPGAASGAGAVVTTYPGNVSAPPPAAESYPVCSHKVQDECQNPGEGGAPGHSRALKYWPGKPASEGGR
jgi:hypothetical protein